MVQNSIYYLICLNNHFWHFQIGYIWCNILVTLVVHELHLEAVLILNQALSKDHESEKKMRQFFSALPKNVTWALYKLYELDFEMFGYGGPEQWYAMGYDH